MLGSWRLVAGVGLFSGGVLACWWALNHAESAGYARGVAEVRAEVQATALAAEEANRQVHARQLQQVKEAQDAQRKKLDLAQADAGRMRNELDRLRGALDATGGGAVPGACADADNHPGAGGELQRVLAQELERVSRQGAEMAEQCDRIVIERDALVQGWPR